MKEILFLGSNLNHSQLPEVYRLIGESLDIPLKTHSLEVTPDKLGQYLKPDILENYLFGCITFPYKVLALKSLEELTIRASNAGSTNIVFLNRENKIIGDNTDGKGFMQDIQNRLGWELAGKHILLLGNGGVSRSLLAELIQIQAANITICMRNLTNQDSFVNFYDPSITFTTYGTLPDKHYEVIINATSASIYREELPLPSHCFSRQTFYYECAYRAYEATTFERCLQQHKVKHYSNGTGMLVAQAVEAMKQVCSLSLDWQSIFHILSSTRNRECLLS